MFPEGFDLQFLDVYACDDELGLILVMHAKCLLKFLNENTYRQL